MKVLGINGSPRTGGDAESILKLVFEPLEAAGIGAGDRQNGGRNIRGCTGCRKLLQEQERTLHHRGGHVQRGRWAFRVDAIGIVLGSRPTLPT